MYCFSCYAILFFVPDHSSDTAATGRHAKSAIDTSRGLAPLPSRAATNDRDATLCIQKEVE